MLQIDQQEEPQNDLQAEEQAPAEEVAGEGEPAAEEAAEETIITIGDEPPPAEEEPRAADWVRDLRKKNREDQKRIRELEDRLRATETKAPEQVIVGKKPALEDFDYDSEKYEAELAGWFERKRKADDAAAQAESARVEQETAWNARLSQYAASRESLGVQDYEDAEATVQETLNIAQQGIIIQAAENPAAFVYATGKRLDRLKALAATGDLVKFAWEAGKLEGQMKVTKRSAAAAPEKRVPAGGGKPVSAALKSGDGDALLEEAQKTGDMTKYREWKRMQREKAA